HERAEQGGRDALPRRLRDGRLRARRGGDNDEGHRIAQARAARRDESRQGSRAGGGQGRRRFPRSAEDHLMAGALWVVGEATSEGLARVSTEVATLARGLGEASKRDVVGVVAAADPSIAAEE